MDYYYMTDEAIEEEIGERFRELRLRKNLTQKVLSKRTLLSVNAIKNLEAGKARLSTAIAVLRELKALDNLDAFIPDPGLSPMQLAKLQGRKRKRASGKQNNRKDENEVSEW